MNTIFSLRAPCVLAVMLAMALSAMGQGTAFTYQGRLTDSGQPANGHFDFRFILYNQEAGGNQVGNLITNNDALLSSGIFTAVLDFGSGAFDGKPRWLDIGVRTNGVAGIFTVLAPRQLVTPTPYAIMAMSASNLAGPIETTNNQPIEMRINGVRVLRLELDSGGSDSGNLIGGTSHNEILQPGSSGDFIGGGGVGWSNENVILTNSSGIFIGAGSSNRIGPNVTDSVIAGGFGNVIQSSDAVIAGGKQNSIPINADYSAIGGGNGNTISTNAQYSAIGGGHSNQATGHDSTVSGGANNVAGRDNDTVAGGVSNTANGIISTVGGGWANVASGNATTIAGGDHNTAGALVSTIGGGSRNTIGPNASFATIPGGYNNTASGQYSFAAGSRANAIHDHAFVWAGGNDIPYPSESSNRFHIYAQQGFEVEFGGQWPGFIHTRGSGLKWVIIGSADEPTRPINTWTGAHLSDGGQWVNASDRNRKTDFAPVNPKDILAKVAALSVQSWRYTNEAASVQHVGPTAQDFKAAFGLGTDDKSIGTIDATGVALSAIQGLNEVLKQKEAQIESLEKRLSDLENLIGSLMKQKTGGAPINPSSKIDNR